MNKIQQIEDEINRTECNLKGPVAALAIEDYMWMSKTLQRYERTLQAIANNEDDMDNFLRAQAALKECNEVTK